MGEIHIDFRLIGVRDTDGYNLVETYEKICYNLVVRECVIVDRSNTVGALKIYCSFEGRDVYDKTYYAKPVDCNSCYVRSRLLR